MTVLGARPQFVKGAMFSNYLRTVEPAAELEEFIVHTGQHYDYMMSDVFFQELNIPPPNVNLGVGSAPAAVQTARILEQLHRVIESERPDAVLVYGDTNSTLGAAVAAVQNNVPVIHFEGGERIYRRTNVPEEINRVLADNCAGLILTATAKAAANLRREGMAPQRVRHVGDLMFDIFVWALQRLNEKAKIDPSRFDLREGSYHLATIHRAENTSSKDALIGLLTVLDEARLPVLMPVHPRVRDLLKRWEWVPAHNLRLIDPVGYFDMLRLLLGCRSCITDSGGVSREAFFARRPAIIPLEVGWWSEIVEAGWATEVGADRQKLTQAIEEVDAPTEYPEALFGDGNSAERVYGEIKRYLHEGSNNDGAWHPMGRACEIPHAAASHFTMDRYRRLLETLQGRGYAFESFSGGKRLLNNGRQFVLMRHDVDFDLDSALRMAQAEAEAGVKSTYFFLVRTDHYNVFSKRASRIVRQILELGHFLGLHFDCAAYEGIDEPSRWADAVRKEAQLVQEWFGTPVSAVSFHRPGPLALQGDPALTDPFLHTYMNLFQKEMCYRSDSGGEWKWGQPADSPAFKDGGPLHLLVHPDWWQTTPRSSFNTLLAYRDRRFEDFDRSLAENCKVFRVGWLCREMDGKP